MAKLPLEGIRVIEFGIGIAVPHLGKILADYGAEVIKIESKVRPDLFRGDDPAGFNSNIRFAQLSLNKKGLALNMKTPKGREIAKRLVKISDAVVENYSLGVLERWGLGYQCLKEIKPDIIVLGMQGLGAKGPHRWHVSWGSNLLSLIGEDYLWNHPGAPHPVSVGTPRPDWTNSILGAFALLAAIYHRARTGVGQFIEAAQVEMAASRLGPAYLEFSMNHRNPQPMGNRNLQAAPRGCYRCRDEETWCVIAVYNNGEWEALCGAVGEPEWTRNERFATHLSRFKNADQLDKLVESWTREHTPEEVLDVLQRAGVTASAVRNSQTLFHDPHLQERGFIAEVDHSVIGRVAYAGPAFKMSETPGAVRSAAPLLGEHNDYVCHELLGMSEEEVAQLESEGVLI